MDSPLVTQIKDTLRNPYTVKRFGDCLYRALECLQGRCPYPAYRQLLLRDLNREILNGGMLFPPTGQRSREADGNRTLILALLEVLDPSVGKSVE